jgi:hypothetical protein
MAVLKIGVDVVYHEYWQEDGYSVICVEDARGEQIGVVRHLPSTAAVLRSVTCG